MRKYETIIVLNPELGEAALKEEVAKLEIFLRNNGVVKLTSHHWGRREIAYRVQKQKFGYWVMVEFESNDGSLLEKLTRQFVITDSVLKFQTVRTGLTTKKFKARPHREGQDDLGLLEADF